MKQRRMILNGELDKKIDFIDNDEPMKEDEEPKVSDEPTLVKIVFDNITELFPNNFELIKQCKLVVKESTLIGESLKDYVKNFYNNLKASENAIVEYARIKLSNS